MLMSEDDWKPVQQRTSKEMCISIGYGRILILMRNVWG